MYTNNRQKVLESLQETYLDWTNNYLTVAQFANDYQVPMFVAKHLIDAGRAAHDTLVWEDKQDTNG